MKNSAKAAVFLVIAAALAAGAITWLGDWAQPRHAAQAEAKREAMIERMLIQDRPGLIQRNFQLLAPNYLRMGDIQTGTRVFEGDKVIQVIYTGMSHEGYNGTIALLVSFDNLCTITHVNIISERETPGLGDQYKKNNHAWLKSLEGKKADTRWALKPAGDIDSWTGATVTPKAMTHALGRMQSLCVNEHDLLFGTEEILYLEISKPE
jgi:electron transport complex protein RnfG